MKFILAVAVLVSLEAVLIVLGNPVQMSLSTGKLNDYSIHNLTLTIKSATIYNENTVKKLAINRTYVDIWAHSQIHGRQLCLSNGELPIGKTLTWNHTCHFRKPLGPKDNFTFLLVKLDGSDFLIYAVAQQHILDLHFSNVTEKFHSEKKVIVLIDQRNTEIKIGELAIDFSFNVVFHWVQVWYDT